MKKVFVLLIALALVFSAAACKSGGAGSGSVSGNGLDPDTVVLTDVMTDILDGVDELPMVGDIEIDDTNFEYYLFIAPIEGAEALASEAMISSVAHSVVLLRVPEGTDAAGVAADIKANANPAKWICVEAEKVEVAQHGNLIMLCMSNESACEAITANFNALFA